MTPEEHVAAAMAPIRYLFSHRFHESVAAAMMVAVRAAVAEERERLLKTGQARFHANAAMPTTWEHQVIEDAKAAAIAEERERQRVLGMRCVDDYEADLRQKDRDKEAAVAAEREACAKLAIELDHPGGKGPGHLSDGYEIAAAIRTRGTPGVNPLLPKSPSAGFAVAPDE